MFEIEDLFGLTIDGAFSSLEEFKSFAKEVDTSTLFSVITPGAFKDLQEFESSLTEKKNQVDTPSDGQEEVTESITETPTEPGSLDSSQENVEQPVEVIEQPVEVIEQPVEVIEQPVEVIEQPVVSTIELIETDGVLTDLTSNLLDGLLEKRTLAVNKNKEREAKLSQAPSMYRSMLGDEFEEKDDDSLLQIDEVLKEKILSDFNIKKALENDIIDLSIIDSALKGNENDIATLRNLGVKSSKETQQEIDEGDLNNPYKYEGKTNIITPDQVEGSSVNSMYNTNSLLEIEGMNILDLDGYLNEKEYKNQYLEFVEKGIVSSDQGDYNYTTGYSPALASERIRLEYLTNYVNNQVERNVKSQILNYQLENDGKLPYLDGVELDFTSGINEQQLAVYIEEQFPLMTSKLKQQDVKNQELYQAMKNGESRGGTQAIKQGWRSVEDRINNFSSAAFDFVGADDVSNQIRMAQAETELDRGDFLRYTYASGKEADVDGTVYLVDGEDQIYDTELNLRVTNVITEQEAKKIRKAVATDGVEGRTFSKAGAAITTAGIASDMVLQIALTRGVGVVGQGTRGFFSAFDSGRKIVNIMSKVPMKATTASAMIAQGTLFSTNLAEQTRRQALSNGLSVSQAEELSSIAGIQGFALGSLTAPISTQTYAMDKIFGKSAKEKIIKGAAEAYVKNGRQGAVSFWRNVNNKALQYVKRSPLYAREGTKEVVQENVQQSGQAFVIGKNINEAAGREIMNDTITGDQFINTTILSLAAGLMMPIAGDVTADVKTNFNKRFRPGVAAIDRMEALYTLSKDVDKTTQLLNSQVTKGVYTEEQVAQMLESINIYRSTINLIPSNLSSETALSVMQDIDAIKKLENKTIKPSEDYFNDNTKIEEQIQALRNNIITKTNFDNLSNKGKRKYKEEAGRQLFNEARERGEQIIEIDNDQITERAIQNFQNTIEDAAALASEKSTEPQVSPDVEEKERFVTDKQAEKVNDLINRPVTLTKLGGSKLDTPIEGDMYVDGQQVVVEDSEGNIIEIGNVDEISNQTLEEIGLEQQVSNVKTDNEGNLQVFDDVLVPDKKGIKRNKRGDVSRVVLRSPDGSKTVTLRGVNAEEAAYQILLNEAQSPEQEQKINELLENDEEFQNELRQVENNVEAETNQDTQQTSEQSSTTEKTTEEEVTKQKEDAISKPSTEEQVLPDAPTSTEGGKGSEVELQQVGEGDVEQVTPDTKIEEGETQADKPIDKTTEGDVEQVVDPTSTEEGMSVKGSKKAPKILGKKPKMVTVNEYNALKTQIKLEARSAREAQQDLKKKREAVNELVKLFSDGRKGQFSPKQLQAVMNRSESTNFYSRKSVDEFLDYMEKVFDNAEHISKEKEGVSIKTKIKNKINKDTENSLKVSAKEFLKLDPKKVSDIDEYLNYANTVLNGLGKTKVVTKKGEKQLKVADPFNIQDLRNYTIKQNKIQSDNNLKSAREYFTELTGLDSDKMTIEEMQDLINKTSEVPGLDKEKIEENKKEIKKALLDAIEDSKSELNSKTQTLNLNVNDKSDLKELLDLDINKLDTKKKMELLDILINFNVNGSLGGAKSFIAKARGNEEMENLVSKGIKSVSSTGSAGRSRNDQLTTLPLVFELMFKGQSKAREVMNALGFNDLMFGSNKAKKQIEKSMSEYSDVFRKIKTRKGKYFDEYNTTERGIIAELLRIEIDSELSEQQQFDNTKSLIKQTYEAYFNTGNKLDNANGKIIEEIYNKIVDKSSNISDLESKVDPANLKGVNYVINNIWGQLRPQLVAVQKSIYNEDLSEDINFTPRTYFKITNQETNEETNLEDAIFEPKPRQSPYDKKSSTLMKANRSGNLPKGRVLNLGFDSNNFNKAEAALTDVLTASAIRQIQGAMDSESFNKVFPNKLSRDIVKNRIIDYVNAKRGKKDITEKDQRFLRRLNRAAGFGVAKVLAGVTQPAKQLVPLANTAVNAGPANTYRGVALLFNGGMKIIDDSGMPIANRGIMSQADIEGLNTLIQKSARTKGGKAIDLLDKVNKKILDVLLVKSDVIAARASFLAYYMQAMNKKGIASNDIDWTKPLEKDAKTFAQQQVDRQQNTSDADLQGRLFTSQKTTPQVLRKVLFPFANFLINQKNRMYSDVSTLFNNKDFIKGDKTAAARSLVGLGVETAIFNLLGYYVSTTLASITASLMGGETPEEEEKRKMYAKRGRIGSVVADVAVPLPFLNDTMLSALNTGMELLESGDEEGDPFRFFAKDEKTVLDNLGVLGIAPKKAKILYEMIDLYRTGVSKNVYMGKKSTANISEDARKKMGTVASVYFLSLLGAGTAETNYMSERALKLAKKTREEKVSKIVPFKTEPEKKRKEEELTMNPKKRKEEFDMNSNKNKEEFNMTPKKNKGEFNF